MPAAKTRISHFLSAADPRRVFLCISQDLTAVVGHKRNKPLPASLR